MTLSENNTSNRGLPLDMKKQKRLVASEEERLSTYKKHGIAGSAD
jgi:hypothetical protein